MEKAIGIIGGSGLYEMDGLTEIKELEIATPFGMPSDKIVTGKLGDRKLAFLPRHGRGHRFLPTEVPFRANIWALKSLGVEWILSLSAVGSLQAEAKPGEVVLPDQFIDRALSRPNTFFGNGLVGHVGMADPVCGALADAVIKAGEGLGPKFHRGGTYVCIEGPTFGTRAESHLYRSWGATVVGMTNATEAKLAREAEICYVTIAMVTDYDCWHEEVVSIEAILEILGKNVNNSKELVRRVVPLIGKERKCGCAEAAKYAIMTAHDKIPPKTRQAVDLLYGKYLKGA